MSTMDTGTTPLRALIQRRRAELAQARTPAPTPTPKPLPASPAGGAVLGAVGAQAVGAATPLRALIQRRRAELKAGSPGVDVITIESGGLARRDADNRDLQAFYAGDFPGDPADPRETAGVVAARAGIPPDQAMETIRQLRANPQGVWSEAPAGPTRERAITDQAIRDYVDANGEAGTVGPGGAFMEGVAGPFKAAGRGVMGLVGRAKEAAGAAVGATIDADAGRDIARAGRGLRTKAEALAATDTPRPEGAAAEVASMAGGLAPYLAMPHRAILPLIGFNSGTEALQAYQAELERKGDPNAGLKAAAAATVVGPTEAALNAIPVGRLIKALEATEPGFAAFLKRQMGHALAGGVGMGGSDAARQVGGLAIGAQDQYDVGRTVKAALTGAAASVAVGAGSEALAGSPAAVGRATRPLRELIAERRAVNAAGREAEASGRAMREEQGAAAVDPSAARPTTIQEPVPTSPTPEGAGPILTPDDRLAPGERVVAPDGRVHIVGNQVGKDQVLLKPEDGGRMRQASAGQLGGRGWRRAGQPTSSTTTLEPESKPTPAPPHETPPATPPEASPQESRQVQSPPVDSAGAARRRFSSIEEALQLPPEELQALRDQKRADEVRVTQEVLGDRYTNSRRKNDALLENIDPAALTPEQAHVLFHDPVNAEVLNDFLQVHARTDVLTPEDLAESIAHDLTQVGQETEFSKMRPRQQQAAFALMLAGKRAAAKGWDAQAITKQAIARAASKFPDPNDALFVLRRFFGFDANAETDMGGAPIRREEPPAAPPKPPPKMIEYKPPGARKPEGPARPWSRRDIEDRILKEYSGSAGKDVADALDTRDEEQNFSDGSGFTSFAGPLPTELREAIAHRPELRTILRTNQPTLRSNGADYLGELGVDRYVARLERAFLGRIVRAKDAMRDDLSNPVARFLVALHDNLPKGKRPTKETIDADSVPVGSTFEIDGHNFTVEEGEGGYRILKDGSQFPPVELDAFNKLPIDKGSLEKPAEPPPPPPAPREEPARVKPAQGSLLGERFEGGTTGGQRSMFDTRKEPAPDLEREYPGIRRGESVEDYKRRMGEEDTPSMFGEEGPEKPAPEELGGDDIAPFAPDKVVRLRGDEMGNGRLEPTGAQMRAFASANLKGKSFTNAETGEDWMVTRNTISHIISMSKGGDSFRLLAGIPELIRTAEFKETRAANTEAQRNLKQFRVFRAEAEVGGRPYTVDLFVKTFDQAGQPVNGLEEIHVLYHQAARRKGPPDRRVGPGEGAPTLPKSGPSRPSIGEKGGQVKDEEGDLRMDAPGRSPLEPSQPTDASVAQRVEDRPRNVAGFLRQARQAGAAQSAKREAVKTIRQIMDALASGVNTRPATVGHNRAHLRKALGFYRLIQGGIVMGKTDDYRTYAHELGHQFHEMLFPGVRSDVIRAGRRARIQDAFPQAWHADLFKLGKALYGSRKPNVGGYETEGWAELVRYIITDPKTGQSLAPTAYNEAIKLLESKHPEVMQLVLRAREQLAATLNSQDPILRYLPAPGKAEDSVWGRAARDILDDITTMLFDDKTRLRTLNRDLGLIEPKTGRHRLGVERDPEAAARRVPGETYADVHRILHDGTFDPSDPAGPKVGKGLVEILEPVRQHLVDADGRGGLWQRYMIAKRVREKRAQGYGGIFAHISDAEIDQFINQSEQLPGFKQAADDFQKLNEWFIGEYAVGHGLLSPEQAQQIIAKNLHYITFRHVDPTVDITKPSRGGGAMADRSSGIRRFKGSSQDLTDPLVAFIQQVHTVAANARKNGATRTLTDILRSNAMGKLGVPEVNRWIEKVDIPMQATRVGEEAFRRAVAKELGQMPEFGQLPQAEQDMLIDGLDQLEGQTFWSPAAASERTRGQQLISVLRNGKREWYKLNDPRLFEIYQRMHGGDSTIPRWINAFMMLPRRLLQAGATSANLTFSATNFLRDITTAMITGEAPVRRVKARARGMVSAFVGGDTARLMENAGVSMSSLLAEYSGRDGRPDLGKLFDDRRFGRTVLSKLKDPTRGVPGRIGRALGDLLTLGPVERLNQRIELATRGGEFEAVRAGSYAAGSVLGAADAARDVTLDFQRGGLGPKMVNRYIPFFNAGFIGAHKTWRSIRDNPRRTAARIASFAVAPALGLMLLNKDDEQYWRLPQLVRDRYYFIPAGTDDSGQRLYTRIPKPHGLGFAAVIAERAFAASLGRDPTRPPGERGDSRAFEGFFTSLATSMLPSVSAGFLQPIIEHASNYDFYRGRPIENWSERRLEPAERFNSRTSDFARALGHWTNSSPIMIDHYIYGYGAGLGRDVTNYVLNPLTRRALIPGMKALGASEPPPPAAPGVDQGEGKLEALPILRGFIARSSRLQTEAILRWQSQYEELQAVEATWRTYTDREDNAAKAYAERYGKEHRRELDAYRAMASYDRAIRKRMKEYWALSAERDGERAVVEANAIAAEVHQLIQDGMASVRETLAAKSTAGR